MKSLMILLVFTVIACGRINNGNDCRDRETVKVECEVVNTPHYGQTYAQEMCNRSYQANKCK
jgi:hypothetical protein